MFRFSDPEHTRSEEFCRGQDLQSAPKICLCGTQNSKAGVYGEGVKLWKITHIECCIEKDQWYLRVKHNLILNNKDVWHILHMKYNVVE